MMHGQSNIKLRLQFATYYFVELLHTISDDEV
jgi:hypothetical protein